MSLLLVVRFLEEQAIVKQLVRVAQWARVRCKRERWVFVLAGIEIEFCRHIKTDGLHCHSLFKPAPLPGITGTPSQLWQPYSRPGRLKND